MLLKEIKNADHLYDDQYASLYNDAWWNQDIWKPAAEFHIRTLTSLLKTSKNWLDVGCGTGYFLSKFPEVDRMGLDLSTNMLDRARMANSEVAFVQQSMTEKNESLEGKFDLVSCTGQPWSYLPDMDAIERSVIRMAEWTSPNGTCMLTPFDIFDVLELELPADFYDMSANITRDFAPTPLGLIWTYKEFDGNYYPLLSPNLDQWVRWFSVFFRKIEIVFRADVPRGTLQALRRIIVCSEKRAPGDDTPASIVYPNEPLHLVREPDSIQNTMNVLSSKQLVSELFNRLKSGRLLKSALRRLS
ncbi:class I SAM-dependent DNA methyltransferase [Parapedobacter sp. 10938]|uniref:class I SAM-dependent DNA methyltransferase n=1 Tax=Parapedobacter flavus TaxID=3110225 RepID=UPI002DBE84F7|nr:class I SAM-dependent methyltransferase [Parapedobacter sp. 10938]MEC3879908.1 class I SAM-dependent methyltransferase [Parapedobacter sp. 10938]